MTIPVEIMLRGNDRVFTRSVVRPGGPGNWTPAGISSILKDILVVIDRVQNPAKTEEPEV